MKKAELKEARKRFNNAVFTRDGYRCILCPASANPSQAWRTNVKLREVLAEGLDAHHITPRSEMPNGGYVVTNGVTVCPPHHEEVEAGVPSPEALYRLIKSGYNRALHDATWFTL